MHRLRPPPFGAPDRRGHRAGVPSPAVPGGWSWGHSRARRRCIRRLRARAWRPRWRRSDVDPSRRASRRTSVSPVRSRRCRAWRDHHGTGSLVDPVVIQAHTAGREVIESPVLIFKLWKSRGGIDQWRGSKPHSALCEMYGKLLAQVVRHWVIVVGAWSRPDRSLTKAAEIVGTLAMSLATAMRCVPRLGGVLNHARQMMGIAARMDKRKGAPNAHDVILCLDQGP